MKILRKTRPSLLGCARSFGGQVGIATLAFVLAATSAFAGWRDTKTSSDTLTAADYNRIIDASWDELGGNIWRASGSVGIGVTAPSSTLDIVGDLEVGVTDLFVDDSAGRVGIGTAAPGYTLDVSGTMNATTVSIGGTAITATGTELNYVDGVTSAIQTQLDAKEGSLTNSAGLLAALSDETGTGLAVFSTTPTFSTSIIAPLVIGGTATTSDLSFQTTSGIGASGADMHFLVGNNGATEAMTILNSGYVGIGTASPSSIFHVDINSDSDYVRFDNDAASAEYINFGNDTTDLEIEFVNDVEGNYVLGIDDTDNLFHIAAASTDLETGTALTINQSGYIGIGTNNPAADLDIGGGGIRDHVFSVSLTNTDNKAKEVGNSFSGGSMHIEIRTSGIHWGTTKEYIFTPSYETDGYNEWRTVLPFNTQKYGSGDFELEVKRTGDDSWEPFYTLRVRVGTAPSGGTDPDFHIAITDKLTGYSRSVGNEYDATAATTNFHASTISHNNGNVGIGTATPAALLEVNQAAAATILDIQDGGSSVFTIADGGAITYPTVSPKRSIILTSAGAVTPTTSGAAQTKVDGTNHSYYVLDYDADADEAAYWHWTMPDSYDAGTVDVTFYWEAAATTGDTVWATQTAGVAPDNAEDIDPTLGAAQTVTDTAQANANDLASATISAWNTGWAAGDYITFKVYRDADNASDTMTGDARLVKVKIEYGANAESD